MSKLILAGEFRVDEILLKTRANGWKNIKPGDILHISLEIDNNSFFGKVHQSRLKIHAISNDYEWDWIDTLSFVHTRLKTNFKVKQI